MGIGVGHEVGEALHLLLEVLQHVEQVRATAQPRRGRLGLDVRGMQQAGEGAAQRRRAAKRAQRADERGQRA